MPKGTHVVSLRCCTKMCHCGPQAGAPPGMCEAARASAACQEHGAAGSWVLDQHLGRVSRRREHGRPLQSCPPSLTSVWVSVSV